MPPLMPMRTIMRTTTAVMTITRTIMPRMIMTTVIISMMTAIITTSIATTIITTTIIPMLMTTREAAAVGASSGMNADEAAALYRLMTWLSPAFPVGAFSYSSGIEWAVEAGDITDAASLRDWLAARTQADPVRTVVGDFHWDKRGLPVGRPFLVLQWQNNKLEFVWPKGEFAGIKDLLWPKPKWP